MAVDNSTGANDISCTAGSTLASSQFCFVKLSADFTVIPCTTATDKPFGVAQDNPASGGACMVRTSGLSKLKGAEALTIGASVGVSAGASTAQVITVGSETTVWNAGIVVGASGAANELASVNLNCPGSRAA